MASLRRAATILAATLTAGMLSGCGSNRDACGVEANGAFGAAVTVSVSCTTAPAQTVSERVITGKGNPVTEGQTVLLRATSFDSRDGSIVSSYDSGHLRLAEVTEDSLGDLASTLVGVPEGSRLIVKKPGLVKGNRSVAEIVVVDVLYSTAHGTQATLPSHLPDYMPTVSVGDGGGPSIAATGREIKELQVVALVEGQGAQVSAEDNLFVQYSITDASGKVLDTTWNGGAPTTLELSSAMDGLREGLVDQFVGSRVVITVPSAKAQGVGDRIVVVDILGIA